MYICDRYHTDVGISRVAYIVIRGKFDNTARGLCKKMIMMVIDASNCSIL